MYFSLPHTYFYKEKEKKLVPLENVFNKGNEKLLHYPEDTSFQYSMWQMGSMRKMLLLRNNGFSWSKIKKFRCGFRFHITTNLHDTTCQRSTEVLIHNYQKRLLKHSSPFQLLICVKMDSIHTFQPKQYMVTDWIEK